MASTILGFRAPRGADQRVERHAMAAQCAAAAAEVWKDYQVACVAKSHVHQLRYRVLALELEMHAQDLIA